jgi:membrane protein YqaA with SNARE-associated domain
MAVTSVSSKRKKYIFGGLFLGGIIAAFVVIVYNWQAISRFQHYGYLGLVIIGLLTGFSLPLPVPYMVVTFIFGGLLHPALVGASCGLGLGIGGTLLYLTGRGGSRFFPWSSVFAVADNSSNEAPPSSSRISRLISRLLRWARIPRIMDIAKRRGSLVVFLMSAAINPFFVPMAIGMGTLRFRWWKFFLMCWAGQTVKSIGIAYAGYLGLGITLRWLQII